MQFAQESSFQPAKSFATTCTQEAVLPYSYLYNVLEKEKMLPITIQAHRQVEHKIPPPSPLFVRALKDLMHGSNITILDKSS